MPYNKQQKNHIMGLMEQVEILILILIMVAITGGIVRRVGVSSRSVPLGLILLTKGNPTQVFRVGLCTILVMALAEMSILCTLLNLSRSNEGGLAQRGITKKINFL